MKKKEHYWHILPHFQQPGQAYFVTWCLKDSVPQKAIARYKTELYEKQSEIDLYKTHKKDRPVIKELQKEYYQIRQKYIKAYNNLLDQGQPSIDLSQTTISTIIKESLEFWERKRLESFAYCIMPNHVHWVFRIYERDDIGNHVYLQDIMHSVKRSSAYKINKFLKRNDPLWQKESFDTTIRDDKHLMNAINYTLNNPVNAGITENWKDWPGCWLGNI